MMIDCWVWAKDEGENERTQASAAQWDEDQHRIGRDKSAGGAAIQASAPVGHLRLSHK